VAEPVQLALDTSTAVAGLCISRAGVPLAEYAWAANQDHNATLMPVLDILTGLLGLTPADLNGVAVALGPGSFNGLRVGLATSKGLALALGVPLVGVSTLEATAWSQRAAGLPVCAVQDAGRHELMAAVYRLRDGAWVRVLEEQVTTVEGLARRLRGRTLLCGEIPAWARPLLAEVLGDRAVFVEGVAATRRPAALAELAWPRLERGEGDDLASLQPLYLRRPNITEPRRTRR
jgi:tRNA threonylcarbamoyl adenosine modification protein YeaZ